MDNTEASMSCQAKLVLNWLPKVNELVDRGEFISKNELGCISYHKHYRKSRKVSVCMTNGNAPEPQESVHLPKLILQRSGAHQVWSQERPSPQRRGLDSQASKFRLQRLGRSAVGLRCHLRRPRHGAARPDSGSL